MLRIRDATVADAGPLAVLAGELGYPTEAAAMERRLRASTSNQAGAVLVATTGDDAVIGFAHALPLRLLVTEPFVDLAALAVAGDRRGIGVGAALLAAVEDWARGHGFASVRVRSSVVRERAHGFYFRHGYAEVKRQAVFSKLLVPAPAGPSAA